MRRGRGAVHAARAPLAASPGGGRLQSGAMSLIFDWSALRERTTFPGTGGRLRAEPADFQVQEVPAYLPGGSGDFLYLHIEKTGHTTAHVVRELCAQLGVRDRDVGVAGLKDRHAVTTQWLSLPGKVEPRLGEFSLPGVRILDTSRHSNKLGLGHLHGTRTTKRNRPGRRWRRWPNTGCPTISAPSASAWVDSMPRKACGCCAASRSCVTPACAAS